MWNNWNRNGNDGSSRRWNNAGYGRGRSVRRGHFLLLLLLLLWLLLRLWRRRLLSGLGS